MKKIIITGFVGQDPQGRHAPSGEYFVTFTVAVNVGTKQNPRTDWVEVACNGKLAEIAQTYLKKGTRVLVEGFPNAAAYINKEGKPVATLKITAKMLEILSSKDSDNLGEGGNHNSQSSQQEDPIDDSVPFTNQF